MFCFDIETLSKSSEAVILSLACIYFNPDEPQDYNSLLKSAFFAKLNVEHQVKAHSRKINKSTIEWWAKQCDHAKNKSLVPSKNDELFVDAYERFRVWIKSKNDPDAWVFCRGMLDQLVLDSYEEQLGIEPIFHYSKWRDIRTAIDFLYGTKNGYATVSNFDEKAFVIKHDPIHDCAYDIMQLVHGEQIK